MPRVPGVVAMPSYRWLFLGSVDHVAATELIDCETDAQVQARADRLLVVIGYPGIEVREYRARSTAPLGLTE